MLFGYCNFGTVRVNSAQMADNNRTKDKYNNDTSQLFNFAQGSYLERSSRPIYAIIFLLPFIVFYELGTIFINTDVLNQTQVRVVAFVWLQNMLEYIGFTGKWVWFAPALAVVLILFALQLTSRKKWRFEMSDAFPMAVECILLAVPLIVFSLFLNSSTAGQNDFGGYENSAIKFHCNNQVVSSCSATSANEPADWQTEINQPKSNYLLANIVTAVGAGIYEELVFRLILICLLMLLFHNVFGCSHRNAVIFSVLVSAALFSAHHHIIFLNGQFGQTAPFNWTEFGFRTAAGIYFAALFAIRGFGITAGTHAFYDIIATVINAMFFQQ